MPPLMGPLLAICGEREALYADRVRLAGQAPPAVQETLLEQERAFRKGTETPFDRNWINEPGEIATAPIPPEAAELQSLLERTSYADLDSLDMNNLGTVRGIASVMDEGGNRRRLLVQVFSRTQELERSRLLALVLERNRFDVLTSTGFRLAEKLVCIVESGLVKFHSLHNLSKIFDTSSIFGAATEPEVRQFAADHAGLFAVPSVDSFLENTSRNARKYIASIAASGALAGHSARSLQEASEGTKLTIHVAGNRIVMPERSGDVTELGPVHTNR